MLYKERKFRLGNRVYRSGDLGLCDGSVWKLLELSRDDTQFYVCFSDRKPRHKNFWTIIKPVKAHDIYGGHYRGRLLEFKGMFFVAVEEFLAKMYWDGYRYVWIELPK